MSEALTFFGLLYVEPGERHANLPARADPLDIYALCAAACARSVAAQDSRFTLITNDAATLRMRYAALGMTVPALVEHRFTRDVPAIPFRAAHRKLELFRGFADGGFGAWPALIDIDTVLLRPWPFPPTSGALQVYDLTNDIAPGPFQADLAMVLGEPVAAPRWWGGEFLVGDPAAFGLLADAVDRLWPRYLAAVGRLHHIGDEAVIAAALTQLAAAGVPLHDVGGPGVRRWWSARTLVRPRATLREAGKAALLHLPADKPFLARYANPARPIAGFMNDYRRYAAAKLPVRHLATLADRLTGRASKFVPRL